MAASTHASTSTQVKPLAAAARPRPAWLRALGCEEPPAEVQIAGRTYQRHEVLKHDSWAATARYTAGDEDIVCKFNRQQSLGPMPMRWLGRWLAARENYLLRRLADEPGVPAYRGPVLIDGRCAEHVASHVWIEGVPLKQTAEVNDEFFARLHDTLLAMHQRGLAYVDLHKGENVLVGDDRRPYLIDFQVCYIRPASWLLARLLRGVERCLQDLDRYHLQKHICATRPDLAGQTLGEWNASGARPWWLRVHRSVAVPLRNLRRRLLVWLGVRSPGGAAHSEHFAEVAHRAAPSRRAA